MKGNIGSINPSPSKVVSTAHPPVMVGMEALLGAAEIADGQIVAKDSNGEAIAHQKVSGVAMTGTVDGANKTFTATLAPHPVLPGSVSIANNNASAQALVDDGLGNLTGDGTGTINYKTGAVSATFTTAPAAGKTVLISHKTEPVGVNVGECNPSEDAAEAAVASVLVHGTVNADLLLEGASAADAEDIAALAAIGIFAL